MTGIRTIKWIRKIHPEKREYWWRLDNGEDEWGNASLSCENTPASTSLQGFRKQLDRSLEEKAMKGCGVQKCCLQLWKPLGHNKLETGKTCWASTVTHLPCSYMLSLAPTLSQWQDTGLGRSFSRASERVLILASIFWSGLSRSHAFDIATE